MSTPFVGFLQYRCIANKNLGLADASASPSLTTVTATKDGKTVTGIYVLETISSLASLRQGITTSMSATTTASDGTTGLETAAAVVLAGGASWFLAGMASFRILHSYLPQNSAELIDIGLLGDAEAAESALESPDSDPEHEDDSKCPKPKGKCSDCGGKDEMICTTGPDANCACEEGPSCGDKKLDCSDDKCKGGDDDKCTTDDNKGCECNPDEKCPNANYLPCTECGGAGDDGKCKGVYKMAKLCEIDD